MTNWPATEGMIYAGSDRQNPLDVILYLIPTKETMQSIAETAIMLSIIELTRRCGLKPSQVDGYLEYHDNDKDLGSRGFYQVEFFSQSSEEPDKTERFFKLLGMVDTWTLKGPELEDLEEKLEQALSLAPRDRAR